MGDQSFYSQGKTIDTNSKITVVTQFIGSSNTLSEIRRIYVQNGQAIQDSKAAVSGMDTCAQDFCDQQKAAFGDTDSTVA